MRDLIAQVVKTWRYRKWVRPEKKPTQWGLIGVQPLTSPSRWEQVAGANVGISTGLKMLTAQSSNEVLRHCRIGVVTPKLKADA